MRMLLKFQLDTETANRAIEDGSTARINEKMFTQMQPEAAYFASEDVVRTGYVVFDLHDPAQIPTIAEPLFSGVHPKLTPTPVMNTDDLMKGLQQAAEAE